MHDLVFGNLRLLIVSVVAATFSASLAAFLCVVLCRGNWKRLSWGFFALPILLAIAGIVFLSANIPYDDDYNTIVSYLAYPFPERLKHLLDYNWEHRVLMTNLSAELLVDLTGKLDFRILTLVGQSFLLGIGIFLYRSTRDLGREGLLLSAAFLWMTLSMISDYFFWAMASIQNYGVLFLGLLALKALKRETGTSFVVALMTGVVMTFTSGSGMLIWPCMFAMLFFERQRGKRAEMFAVSAVGLASILCYFSSSGMSQGQVQNFSLLNSIGYFLTFAGGWLCVPGISILGGLVILGVFIKLFLNVKKISGSEYFYFGGFILMTMAVGAIFRSGRIINALPPRHPELPFTLLACALLLAFKNFQLTEGRRRFLVVGFSALAVFINVFSLILFGSIWKDRFEIDRRNLLVRPIAVENLTSIHGPWKERAVGNLTILSERGVYDSLGNLRPGEVAPTERIDPGDYWTPGRSGSHDK